MALQSWALPRLSQLLPLDEAELRQILAYTDNLSLAEAAKHLGNLLGDSPQATEFITAYSDFRTGLDGEPSAQSNGHLNIDPAPTGDVKAHLPDGPYQNSGGKSAQASSYAPPPNPPPGSSVKGSMNGSLKQSNGDATSQPPIYAPPSNPLPASGASVSAHRGHTNKVIEAATMRARDEQEMQNLLQTVQYQFGIYNPEIEPEHDTDWYCNCAIHYYMRRKWSRFGVQDLWSKAVMYPGEKSYNDNPNNTAFFGNNPYQYRMLSPYGMFQGSAWGGVRRPQPSSHATWITQTIQMNNSLNQKAQANIDDLEPKASIWEDDALERTMSTLAIGDKKRQSLVPSASDAGSKSKSSRFASVRKSIGIKSSDEKAVGKAVKNVERGVTVRNEILVEEQGRWPDAQWRDIVMSYQEKVGMKKWIADLRARKPIQYLHLLRAGYFEPIPVAWATQNSNPLKFSIESASGWRGITPAWRGYEDTAEERLYWVLNHREGSVGMRMKPDFISEMNMANARMATAVEPPPQYYSANDVCHTQHTSAGYSKQVMPSPFRAFDRPEVPTDDTMILLDVSGSMDFDAQRPNYNQYLITGYSRSTQPKNKFVAKAIIRRFSDAMAHHDHQFRGYDLVTFSDRASYIGTINHQNLESMWNGVRIGGGTRVMTGWQKCKDLHFQKHSESATKHPVYGWQAGPQTPMLRLLLLLDGEAQDMDELELDLLGLTWAHVTIFLIGVDGCPHHHRHANELQRISDVNHHVSFVDAQGNTPERFVTHELLKRHLGYDMSMREFEEMEQLPAYTAVEGEGQA